MNRAKIHRVYSHHWFTPIEWQDWVRATIGDYFDPCPAWCTAFDGLKIPWPIAKPVYVNHPGGRGNTQKWWERTLKHESDFVWCGFSFGQLRTLQPSPVEMDGYLVIPRQRIAYVWGGPTTEGRVKGRPVRSPANDSFFFTTRRPAPTPIECIVIRTGDTWITKQQNSLAAGTMSKKPPDKAGT